MVGGRAVDLEAVDASPGKALGQLTMLLRARYLVVVQCLAKVQGRPFSREEIEVAVLAALANGKTANGKTANGKN